MYRSQTDPVEFHCNKSPSCHQTEKKKETPLSIKHFDFFLLDLNYYTQVSALKGKLTFNFNIL